MFDPKHNPLHRIARWVSSHREPWPSRALGRANDAVLDTVSVMIAGQTEPIVRKVQILAEKWGSGPCTAIGQAGKLSTPMAALVNGTMAHALDFDDNFDPAKAHASAVLVPALLSVAEERDIGGRDLLDAYIVGLQCIGLIGQGVNPFHRSRGWHATATIGSVGTTGGLARLMKLDAERTAHAISLATSYAGGFMSQFGTMTKPLHAGIAAAGAVQAAEAAEAGITAGSQTLHGPTGMGTLMVGPDVEELRQSMIGKAEHGQTVSFEFKDPGIPLHIEEYGLKVKRFPNCGSVHRSLDGFIELRDKHGLTPDNVEKILVRAPAAHLNNLMYTRPIDAMQAKFSLEYGLAVALQGRSAGLGDYTDEKVNDPSLIPLMEKVERDYVDMLESEFPTEVHVTMTSGKTVSTHVVMPKGSTADPLTKDQLWQKFYDCTQEQLDKDRTHEVQSALEGLRQETKIRDLMALLGASG